MKSSKIPDQYKDIFSSDRKSEIFDILLFLRTIKNHPVYRTPKPILKILTHLAVNEEAVALFKMIMQGQTLEVYRKLKSNPELLFAKEIITDQSHRRISGTALQLALGSGNIVMAKAILSYFFNQETGEEKIKNGLILALKQINEQFPKGDYRENRISDHFQNIMQSVVEAISSQNFSVKTLNKKKVYDLGTELALDAMRKYLQQDKKIITHGVYFNLSYLMHGLILLNKHFKQWKPNHEKISLFWCRVIGYLQRFVCFSDMAVLIGTSKHNYYRKSDQRWDTDLQLTYDPEIALFPLVPDAGLGFDFGILRGFVCYDLAVCGTSQRLIQPDCIIRMHEELKEMQEETIKAYDQLIEIIKLFINCAPSQIQQPGRSLQP